MGFGDRIRAFFSKRSNPALDELAGFIASRQGIEGFVEPRTNTNPTTLLLVDRDGDHRRAPVREPSDAYTFCERNGIPVYDAQVIGYPRRMRDFEKRRRSVPLEDIDREIEALERQLSEPEDPTQG